MTKPNDTLWAMEPHTKGKHIVLRSYLDAWLPIMSHGARFRSAMGKGRLVLVDGFAGPGRYSMGEDGSPLVMLKAFLEHTQRHLISADLLYLFIEERRDRIEYLREEVAALHLPAQVDVHFEEGRFEDVFTGLLDNIESSGAQLAPTFAFIDPFGYTGNPMDLAGRFLAFQRCEALVYMPLPFVNRFVGREGQEQALTALFGSERWQEALSYQGAARVQFLHELFQEQLCFGSSSRLVRSFEICEHMFAYRVDGSRRSHPLGLQEPHGPPGISRNLCVRSSNPLRAARLRMSRSCSTRFTRMRSSRSSLRSALASPSSRSRRSSWCCLTQLSSDCSLQPKLSATSLTLRPASTSCTASQRNSSGIRRLVFGMADILSQPSH
jgi:three-Cys-motif partner protein